MIGPYLPLFVAAPLLLAGLTALVRGKILHRSILLATPVLSALAACWLLSEHLGPTPVLVAQLGAFVPGVAIAFVSDTLAAVMLIVTGFSTAIVLTFAIRSGESALTFFTPLVLILIAGVNGVILTGDIFNLFVFIEVMLLPSYALLAMTGTWRRLGVGRLFLTVNLVTSAIFLIGIALMYGAGGAVNIAVLAGQGAENPGVALGAGVVLLALIIKAGAVPVHGWLPRAYPGTSAMVMALFGSLHSKVALYAIYRIYSVVYGGDATWLPLLLAIALASILVGVWASFEGNAIRRVLAFQLVGSAGFILLGVGLSTHGGLAAGLFYLVHSVLTFGALILASGAIEKTYGSAHLVRLSNLLRREKALAWIFGLAMLSLVGFPPSSGFWGKVTLVITAARMDSLTAGIVISVIVVASILSLLALQRLWHEVFWGPKMELYRPADPLIHVGDPRKPAPLPDWVRIPFADLAPAATMLGLSLLMFVFAGPLWSLARAAVAGLIDPSLYVEAVLP
ncbi:MAG: proton-conducting transporter membrane subunit [Actinomycetia bacterium]|nr:proton-conducting transporter membrane subunit [Actinomycetes bacterium]